MTATLTISNGTVTADLLTAKVSWQLLAARSGWIPSGIEYRQIRRESIFAEGEEVIESNPKNVVETFTVSLRAASHDAVATLLQALETLAANVRDFHTRRWQKTPVYLSVKTNDETNTRYAVIVDIRVIPNSTPFGTLFNTAKTLGEFTILVERVPYWSDTIPLTLPSAALTIGAPQAPGTQADATEQFVANFRDTSDLTHQYNYDDSLTAFSANQIASNPFTYWVVSGSTPALNDIAYFGSTTGPFRFVVLRIGTAGSFSATITWEVWTGATWVSTAGMIRENATFTSTGNKLVVMDSPTGWATTAINGVTAYWIRARISAFTSWTTSPIQSGQVLYNPRDAYISIADTQINGDVDALAMIRFAKYQQTTNGIRYVAMGLKSRGLTNFTSRLNAGGQNPSGWSESYGTDTSEVADIESPGNSHALCTFATDQGMVTRVTITNSTEGTVDDFEGDYHAYIRCQQIGGTAGATSVRLAFGDGSTNLHVGTQTLTVVASGMELLSMGRVSIYPFREIETTEAVNPPLEFYLQASATSATPDIRFYDLILIPIDEWSYVAASDATIPSGELAAINGTAHRLECDGGLIRKAATVRFGGTGNNIERIIESRGTLPRFPPDKQFQIHFLFSALASSLYESDNYLGGSWKVYVHQRWAHMRGSE